MNEKDKVKIPWIFISGPMTGFPNYNFGHFNEVAAKLDKHGIFNVNPVKICKKFK